jgi:hypothetical protein
LITYKSWKSTSRNPNLFHQLKRPMASYYMDHLELARAKSQMPLHTRLGKVMCNIKVSTDRSAESM